ncbi:UV damage endonuclease UvdE [Lichtheimia ornata]|uniref:UV damage endonuclease UvdE n=1 Tax=Lichtheimia ornata TaxID=688661 RepID=A0AAD7XPE5_9FUNG|nr:UV damage endonuclease UvdE [Lichtheimia ornata]KAJ8651769.1 UV damage endonuclease UvdE [Lichtheimia ornata]
MSTFMKQKPAGRFVHPNPRSYKGRLGYACLNTILRHQKPPVFCSRTCRIETIRQKGIDFVKELALQNVRDLSTLIEWNEAHGIKFMRMSSDIFPFAGHKDYGYSLDFAKSELECIGELAAKYKHRLTLHPGQFNQLGSPNPDVVENTIRDLSYHAEMLDLMKLPPDSIMIIHMGGVYGDKASAIARFEENYKNLTDAIKKRLVLENDELGYSVTDLLPVCQRLGIPLVLDWHHHDINPGEASETLLDLLPAINETWHRKGIKPKQHYSESRPGAVSAVERRAHSDRVMNLPPSSDDVDLMIEAKEKEQAVFQLYKLFDLYPVDDDVWIANKKIIPKSVKANKRKKAVAVKVQDDAIVEENTIVEEEEEMIIGMRTRSRSRKKTKKT